MKITRHNISEHLMEYQLEKIGKTVQDAIDNKEWIREWSWKKEQYDEFKKYAIPLIKKVFRCNKKRAETAFAWFDLQFGLKIQKDENNN